MIRVGITQRVEVVPDYGERRDCLDQEWVRVVEGMGLLPVLLPNSAGKPEVLLSELGVEALFLTGGNDIARVEGSQNAAPERDTFETRALEFAVARGLPVVGVCRGLQFVNLFFGGRQYPVKGHVATRHLVHSTEHAAKGWPAQFEVNSFHGWGVSVAALGEGLVPTALDSDGNVEGLRHEEHRICAVMWHPEREPALSPVDLAFFREGMETSR